MNEDTFQKLWWGIIKWTIGIIGTLAILGGIFRALFYSVNLANLSFIIPLRNWYQDTYWKAEWLFSKPQRRFPPFDPVYNLYTDGIVSNETFHYIFRGYFVKLDDLNKLIFLGDSQGKRFIFYNDSWKENANTDNDFPMFQITGNFPYGRGAQSHVTIRGKDYLSNLPKNTIFEVRWTDTRSLKQIEKDYALNPDKPLNLPGQTSGIVTIFIYN